MKIQALFPQCRYRRRLQRGSAISVPPGCLQRLWGDARVFGQEFRQALTGFDLAANPSPLTLDRGTSATCAVAVTRTCGFTNGEVYRKPPLPPTL